MNERIYNIYQINNFLFEANIITLTTQSINCPLTIHMYLDKKLMFGISDNDIIYPKLKNNTDICITAYKSNGQWFRYTGKIKFEDNEYYSHLAKKRSPNLTRSYNDVTKQKLMMFHLEDASAYIIDEYNHTYHCNLKEE